ncbi:uncharacterized protein E0L32_007655 [Thyridium curvatum]|uniref:Alpha/beta hydrolase fold-3 domain-containing protein n=1 Tax=Thyridium curvatum TaxID=1093900 RepID=A0A507AY40_9PEZI|nr:uncharacterized protein E0L32_007655 [Thyridium curvatum]TPX11676.1 hypothetical protein E0L32_007655 [Thyridium curvatum]
MADQGELPSSATASAPSGSPASPTDAIPRHILDRLDPEFIQFFIDVQSKVPPAQDMTIELVRASPEKFRAPCALDTSGYERVKDYEVASKDGARFPVRVYSPDPARFGEGPYPVHLNFHVELPAGGGFVLGDLMSEASLCLSMRDGAGVVIVDVNYRHCPETVWGKCFEDAFAALNWVHTSPSLLNIDPQSISIGGISAGGHITVVLQHMARDAGIPLRLAMPSVAPSSDALTYKDYTDSPYRSFVEFYNGPVLPWARIHWFGLQCFPPDRTDEIRALWPEWWVEPIKAANLAGLCETFMRTGEMDPLRDEGEAYAEKLKEGGVRVRVKRYPGSVHTFMYVDSLGRKKEYDRDSVEALRAAHGVVA